jgi:CubicO group peptidase (beta-lactamase class C family)
MRITWYHGHREVEHLGGGLGYGAIVPVLPDRRTGVVAMANRNNALLNRTADAALDALLGEEATMILSLLLATTLHTDWHLAHSWHQRLSLVIAVPLDRDGNGAMFGGDRIVAFSWR